MKSKLVNIVSLFLFTFLIFNISAYEPPENNTRFKNFGSIDNEEKGSYPNEGIIYKTIVNDNNLNVRSIPSLKGKVLQQLNKGAEIKIVGISRERDFIDNYKGHWFNISLDGDESIGWVFSKYVDFQQSFISEIIITEMKTGNWNEKFLIGSYKLKNETKTFSVPVYNVDHQKFYTFAWDFSNGGFHYSNIPGTYIWDNITEELKHITYLGGESTEWGASLWIYLTDDFKYILEDFGTGPPPRNVKVWRIDDGEKVFDGSYNSNINLKGNTIEIVYSYRSYYDDWNEENSRLSDEILKFGRKFMEENPLSENELESVKSSGGGIGIIIYCEHDLDTGKDKLLRAEYKRYM